MSTKENASGTRAKLVKRVSYFLACFRAKLSLQLNHFTLEWLIEHFVLGSIIIRLCQAYLSP